MKEPTGQLGKVVFEHGKFYLDVNDHWTELPIGLTADEKQLREMVGKEVEVLYSEPIRYIVALVPRVPRIPRILCYIPAPDSIFNRSIVPVIDKEMRVQLANRLVDEKIISNEVREKIIG